MTDGNEEMVVAVSQMFSGFLEQLQGVYVLVL